LETNDSNLFIKDDDINEIQQDQLVNYDKFKNLNLENFYYNTHAIEKYEIELLCRAFPNLKMIILEGENILETKVNLLNLKNL
jgi:hypothetical protein